MAGACFLVPTGSMERVLDSRRGFLELFPGWWTQLALPQLLMARPEKPQAAGPWPDATPSVQWCRLSFLYLGLTREPQSPCRACLDGAGPPGICSFIQELNGSFIRISKIHF